jgi:hypothetical protein
VRKSGTYELNLRGLCSPGASALGPGGLEDVPGTGRRNVLGSPVQHKHPADGYFSDEERGYSRGIAETIGARHNRVSAGESVQYYRKKFLV